jgi:hypothetical protein
MKVLLIVAATIVAATTAFAGTDTFDKAAVGSPPPDWTCGVTGQGSPRWTIEADSSAPSQPNVLKQSGSGTFPWCVKRDVSIADGYVEVKFKPLEGRKIKPTASCGAGRIAITITSREPMRWRITYRSITPREDVESPSSTLIRLSRGTSGTRCMSNSLEKASRSFWTANNAT